MSDAVACIVADWGTSNLRAWALAADGRVLARRSDRRGVLSIADGGFAAVFADVCGSWLEGTADLPAILCGMIGSRKGWREVPYLLAPLDLGALAGGLYRIGNCAGATVGIVPGVALDDPVEPEVMRGEETQILGALCTIGRDSASFLLPGTHSKWAIVDGGRLVSFRSYMTGEVFGLLGGNSTIAQLIQGDAVEAAAFRRGVVRAKAGEGRDLLHALFGVRTLSLFDRLAGQEVRGYLSGLLIGAEFCDAARWLAGRGGPDGLIAVGEPAMVALYAEAAAHFDLNMTGLDSAAVLPAALYALSVSAGLMPQANGGGQAP